MKINICFRLSKGLVKLEEVDSSFIWESDYIPNIGDSIDYTLKPTPVDFAGLVIKRTFYPDSSVLLEVEIPKYVATSITKYLGTKTNE